MNTERVRAPRVPLLFLPIGAVALLASCVMKGEYYGSMLELNERSSMNYAQQIVNAVVRVRDTSELPTFFYVESGTATWTPTVQASVGATAALGLSRAANAAGDSLQVAPSVGGSESLTASFQLNDFSPAAMSRVTGIFGFVLNPIGIGGSALPNGAFHTILSEGDSSEGFVLFARTADGRFVGVPKEKQFEFFKLARDLVYWSRLEAPDANDLESVAGALYGFFARYPAAELALYTSVMAAAKSDADYAGASAAHRAATEAVRRLETEFRQSDDDAELLKAILEQAYAQLAIAFQQMGGAGGAKQDAAATVEMRRREIEALVATLHTAVSEVKRLDPDGGKIDVDAVVKPFRTRIDGLVSRNAEILKEIEFQLPSSNGLRAKDTVDKLYRDREESLPDRFNN